MTTRERAGRAYPSWTATYATDTEYALRAAEELLHRNALFDLRRQGNHLKARCSSDRGALIFVRVALGKTDSAHSHCTCLTSRPCAHMAALHLAWQRSPEQFVELADLADALRRTPIEVQVELLHEVLRCHPDLDALIDGKLGLVPKEAPAPDTERFQRQVEALFAQARRYDGAVAQLLEGLDALIRLADDHRRLGHVLRAATIYHAVARGAAEHCVEIHGDAYHDVHSEAESAACAVGTCLDAASGNEEIRRTILRMLLELSPLDPETTFRPEETVRAALVQRTTPEEQRLLLSWTLEMLQRAPPGRRIDRHLAHLLLGLDSDAIDDSTFLDACRATGRMSDHVARLLRRGRLEEAITEVRGADDKSLPALANVLVQSGHAEAAKAIVTERLSTSDDVQQLDWIKSFHVGQGHGAAAIDVARRAFFVQPGIQRYRELRAMAEPLGTWDKLRTELLDALLAGKRCSMVGEIQLDEGDVDGALDAAERELASGGSSMFTLRVARAIDEVRPQAALRLYAREVERLIEQGSKRSRYREACALLARMREVHLATGDEEGWKERIVRLRWLYGARSALLDEMTEARL